MFQRFSNLQESQPNQAIPVGSQMKHQLFPVHPCGTNPREVPQSHLECPCSATSGSVWSLVRSWAVVVRWRSVAAAATRSPVHLRGVDRCCHLDWRCPGRGEHQAPGGYTWMKTNENIQKRNTTVRVVPVGRSPPKTNERNPWDRNIMGPDKPSP